jgi:hypothetical protein
LLCAGFKPVDVELERGKYQLCFAKSPAVIEANKNFRTIGIEAGQFMDVRHLLLDMFNHRRPFSIPELVQAARKDAA